jgi:hypothetical protein
MFQVSCRQAQLRRPEKDGVLYMPSGLPGKLALLSGFRKGMGRSKGPGVSRHKTDAESCHTIASTREIFSTSEEHQDVLQKERPHVKMK